MQRVESSTKRVSFSAGWETCLFVALLCDYPTLTRWDCASLFLSGVREPERSLITNVVHSNHVVIRDLLAAHFAKSRREPTYACGPQRKVMGIKPTRYAKSIIVFFHHSSLPVYSHRLGFRQIPSSSQVTVSPRSPR